MVLVWGYVQDRTMRQLPNGVWYIAAKTTPLPVTSEDDIAVIYVWNPYRYTWQKVDKDNNLIPDTPTHRTRFTNDICPDYISPADDFKVGTILDQMIHTDEGSCWSLNPDKHCGYFKRRVHDKPVLANLTEIGDMQ